MEFSALSVGFDGLSLDFLGSRKLLHEGIKEWYPHKTHNVGQSFMKMIADRHGHAAYHNKR